MAVQATARQAVHRRIWWLVLVVVALLTGGSALHAQGGGSTSQSVERIRQRMEKGLALFVAGKSEAAAAEFEAGYQEQPYSAFLFNAGVCYQKMNRVDLALAKFREYLRIDPTAPDTEKVKERVAALEALQGTPPVQAEGMDAGVEPPPPPPTLETDDANSMRSLVIVETEPVGAPVRILTPVAPGISKYQLGAENAQWREVIATTAPASISLTVGSYQIVIDKFRDFNPSTTSLEVSPGHVHHFKANLSQGAFMAFLRVSSNVRGAYIYLDDQAKQKPEWGATPFGELVPKGRHEILLEAPGFKPMTTTVDLESGEQKEVEINLERVDYGYLLVKADAPAFQAFLDDKPSGDWQVGRADPGDVLGKEGLMIRADAGPHRLSVESDGRKDLEVTVDVPRGQILPLKTKLIPKYPRGAAWTQAVIGAAAIGAGIYFGSESEELKDQLERDRRAGRLEADDSRITQGRWYAIGADAGFAIGGVFAVLSTINFIKDPLPESSAEQEPPLEFVDPKGGRVVAALNAGRPPLAVLPSRRGPRAEPEKPKVEFTAGPVVGEESGGFFIGGTF